MKKLFTLLAIYFLAIYPICSIKAADVSVVEDYSHARKQGQQNSAITYKGYYHSWTYRKVRIKEDILDGQQAIWFSRYFSDAANNSNCYFECASVEGGIKALAFNWQQAHLGDDNGVLRLEVEVGGQTVDAINVIGGTLYRSPNIIPYSNELKVKSNAKLSLRNKSHVQDSETMINGRILVGPITITPYILYQPHCKHITLGLKQKGFKNYLIDNTEGEGIITYSSSDESKATVDEDGVITPIAITEEPITITASWEDCTTSYSLTIIGGDVVVENFSKIGPRTAQLASEESWEGDFGLSWKTRYVSRDWSDTLIQNPPRVHGTLFPRTDSEAYFDVNNIEGGVKHLYFAARQVGTCAASCNIDIRAYYAASDAVSIGTYVAKLNDAAGEEGSEVTFDYNIDTDGTKGNGHLRFKNASDANTGVSIVIPNIQITPYLLYTTKECTLDMQVASADPTRTFKNEDLIDNTGASPTYSILGEPSISVQIDEESGEVTVADRFQTGDITVQAKWSEVTTKYLLHVKGKTATSITCPAPEKRIGLTEEWSNAFTVTPNNAPVVYASSNTSVATIDDEGTVTIVGVGQTTISATINEGENYGASSASYTLYITDNSVSVQVERFSNVPKGNAAKHAGQLWAGDVYNWRVPECGGVRKYGDKFASDQEREGIWMGTPDPNDNYSSLTVENGVEGGIKHIWFYVEQPNGTGETDYTLKPVVYLNSVDAENIVAEVEVVGTSGVTKIAANRKLFGASNVTKSNSVLIIQNESYLTEDGSRPIVADTLVRGRILLDEIHITPYLLYTEKSATLDTRDGTKTYKNMSLIDNTEGGNISYTSSDPKVATVDSEGIVTAKGIKGGTITITATWDDEGAGAFTTYELTVIVPEAYSNKETFNSIITTANYTTLTDDDSKQGDVATWSTLLGGFNPDAGNSGRSVDDNCARFKARYSNETGDSYPYIQSSTIPGGIKSLKFKCKAGGDESATTWIIKVYINNDEFTVPAESIPTNASQEWKPVEISDINVAGDFVIRFENQSTISNYTEGNKGRLLIDDIEWEGLPMALKDNESNAALLGANNGYKRNVMLADRTIRTGGYNTLCLPFAMSEEQLAESPLAGGKVYNFTNAYLGTENLDIRFEKVNSMEAGKPYLVTVPADVENPVFEGVTIKNSTENNTATGANMRFIGSFNQETMNETGLYIVANSLYRVENITSWDKTIGACRAYFDVLEGAPAVPAGVRMRIMEEEVATEIMNVQSDNVQCTKVMENGVLYLMYKGTKYNVQGARVK